MNITDSLDILYGGVYGWQGRLLQPSTVTMNPIFCKDVATLFTRWSVSRLLVTDNMTVYLLILVTNLRKNRVFLLSLHKASFSK